MERTLCILFRNSNPVGPAQHSLKHFFEKNWQYFVVAALSVLAFVLIYGYHVINPVYTDWLLGKGDLSQHYIGWQAFRNGSWLFPIGMTDQLSYPGHSSIIFTDSIPVFAVFFKLFRAVLPTEFQYFGLWGILCFVLQGVFAARLIQRFVPNRLYVILTSMLFVLAPVMIWRMYAHTALAGQWILLFALDTFFAGREKPTNRIAARWAVLGALSSAIHIYFVLMCGIILAGFCLEDVIRTKRILKSLMLLIVYSASALLVVALLGGLSSGMGTAGGGLGMFSFNLNAFFNPQGWSRLLSDLSTYGDGQYEGFAYLGAGILTLAALALVAIVFSRKIRAGLRSRSSQVIALCVVFIVAGIAALSPIITLNNNVLLEVPLPRTIENLWGIFRASGRIGWIMVYLIMLGAVVLSYRFISRRSAIVVAALVLCLQVFDIQQPLLERHEEFSQKVAYQSELSDVAFWNDVAQQENIRHVVLVQRFAQFTEDMKWSIANWAMDNQLTLSDYYFARDNTQVFSENWNTLLANPNESELFLIQPDNAFETAAIDLNYYLVDGLLVGTVEPLPGQTTIDIEDYMTSRYTFGNLYLVNGEDRDGIRYLYANGESYGPFWSLPEGTYQVIVSGSNLTQCKARARSSRIRYEISALSALDDQISFVVTVEESTYCFEVPIENRSDEEVALNFIEITRVG